MNVREAVAARRPAVIAEWLDRTLGTYPPAVARLMTAADDPFRNPAGHTLRTNLAALFDAAIVSDDWDAATRAIDEIVRLRAVQGFAPAEAVAFVAMLDPILRDVEPAASDALDLDVRLARLAEAASRSYEDCRARIETARANEATRRTWNLARLASSRRRRAGEADPRREPENRA